MFERWASGLPLPRGEGRGEGNGAPSLPTPTISRITSAAAPASSQSFVPSLRFAAVALPLPKRRRRPQRPSPCKPSCPNAARSPAASPCPPSASWLTRKPRSTPRCPGYLKTLTVDKGDAVKEGQLLAEIEVPELLADEVQYKAETAVSRTNYERMAEARQKAPDLVVPADRGRPARPMGGGAGQTAAHADAAAVCPDRRARSPASSPRGSWTRARSFPPPPPAARRKAPRW